MHLKKEHNIVFDENVHEFDEKNVENIRKLHAGNYKIIRDF
jgi:hypothetical protein